MKSKWSRRVHRYGHRPLFGDTPLDAGDYSLGGLDAASLHSVPVTVTSGSATRSFDFDLLYLARQGSQPE